MIAVIGNPDINRIVNIMEFLCFKWNLDNGYAASAETTTSNSEDPRERNTPMAKALRISGSFNRFVQLSSVKSLGHSMAKVACASKDANTIHRSGIKNIIHITESTI
jgi:hypothetical protein